ncbi:hypothetical protein COT98_03495 [Candidatus Falkowbacteria bacterium CG10_big_fil_rev_8_21_14_0_10_39_9]|uniref:Uncharacterized protein n=1 Tax=Candidatus Falkowbacteria bacterium CG10_big_fil_rev_8_21_14_0_10_39_9 TaxID=1974566 RepID=A0A2M6WNZ0_9BACT|nr:MAG: hypothetical protein COT98_03495 [Candidatus Falkowbacteria bacterium CG10_big_fil_rev_8_21_14_0_10_39_9]
MLEDCIYGVSLNNTITPLMVRDAIVECFYSAHCADSGLGDEDPKSVKKYCTDLIINAFVKTGGDYNNPTKDSIFQVLNELETFSKNFRNPKIIKDHYNQIMRLVELLP